ncbi:hypothetical protein ES703_61460 [subsurface metagenome]
MDKDPGTPYRKKVARGIQEPERPGIISLSPWPSLRGLLNAIQEMFPAQAPFSAVLELPAMAAAAGSDYLFRPPQELG